MLLFYDWCSSVPSLTGSFRQSGRCERVLGTGVGGDAGQCLSGDMDTDSPADPKQRRQAPVCVIAFDRRVSAGLLFCSSSPTHVCVSVVEWKRLSQKEA